MTYQEDQHNQAKSAMLGEFNKAILDAENLRKAETEAWTVVETEEKKG